MSLRVKLLLWYTSVFAISGCLLTTGLYLLIVRTMEAEADKFLEEEHDELSRLTRELLGNPSRLDREVREELAHERSFPLAYRLYDTSTSRDVLALSAQGLQEAIAALPPITTPDLAWGYSTVEFGTRGRELRVLTGALERKKDARFVLQLGMYNRWLEKRSTSLQRHLMSVLVSVLLVAAVGGWVLASRSLKPVDRMVTELSRIESANLADRLEVGSAGGEVDRLRKAINRMLGRLNAAFDRLQSFTADAAHELRTPIAALRCRLEVAINKPRDAAQLREALSEALDQVGELQTLVDNMLFLARLDAEPRLPDVAPVEVCALLADVAEPFALLAEQKGVTLAIHCDPPIHVEGNAVFLRRIFGNLLDNAVRYTPAGGQVAAEARREDDGCVVEVRDTGVGIAPDALANVFKRFYRADESRSRAAGGAGLGLSIVRRAVELHRGTVAIESQPGQGTTVRVFLPARPPPPGPAGGKPADDAAPSEGECPDGA